MNFDGLQVSQACVLFELKHMSLGPFQLERAKMST